MTYLERIGRRPWSKGEQLKRELREAWFAWRLEQHAGELGTGKVVKLDGWKRKTA